MMMKRSDRSSSESESPGHGFKAGEPSPPRAVPPQELYLLRLFFEGAPAS
jgi:hypothetical protein